MLLALALAPPAFAKLSSQPGFDCRRARSAIERRICASPTLSQLDGEMARLYWRIQQETRGMDGETGRIVDPVADEQQAWLRDWRNRCTSSPCLERAYRTRLAQMRRTWADVLEP